MTTCHQAEVLYPEAVPISYLRTVYVATGPHADVASALREILLTRKDASEWVQVVIRPDAFGE